MRVQMREDGLSIDQIVLSHTVFLNASPGTLKNDTTILRRRPTAAATPPPPPPPPPPPTTGDVVLYAAEAPIVSGAWSVERRHDGRGRRRGCGNPNAGAAKVTTALGHAGRTTSR